METGTIPIIKTYSVNRKRTFNSVYKGPVEWIAHLFYTTIDCNTDNVIITIYGDFHQTWPNPFHLRITFTYNGITSPNYHISTDEQGYGYIQPISQSGQPGMAANIKHSKVRKKHRKTKKKKKEIN